MNSELIKKKWGLTGNRAAHVYYKLYKNLNLINSFLNKFFCLIYSPYFYQLNKSKIQFLKNAAEKVKKCKGRDGMDLKHFW